MNGVSTHNLCDSAAREARIKSIFLDAAAMPPEAWRAFVIRQAGEDAALAQGVMELLESDSAASVLDGRAVFMVGEAGSPGRGANLNGELAEADPREAPPARVGRYRIIAPLGHGASGVVYEAEQEQPSRRIAVKVLHPGANAGVSRRRFVQEAQVMALLVHPMIAHAYELDIDPRLGRPFIAMELVPGATPITQHARARGLDVKARVALIIHACEAVHYAHSKGVIHRDLKPANVLVSDEGKVKIVDFGVARLTRRAAHNATTAGSWLIGTLEYVSPEQVRGDAGTASDLYSLAAILYELICDVAPVSTRGMDVFEALDQIQHTEPVNPRKHNHACGRDLSAVLLKALCKNPSDRYDSVAAFAADLERCLRGDPVTARPPGAPSLVWRAARRRPGVAVGVVAVVLGVLGGWAWSWQVGEHEKAMSGRMIAAAADAMDFLQYRIGGRQARRALFDAYMPVIEDLAAKHPDDARLQRLLARLCSTGGELAREQGNPAALAAWRTRELSLMRRLVERTPAGAPDLPDLRHALSLSIVRMGNDYEDKCDYRAATEFYQEARRIQEELSEAQPNNPALADDLFWSYRRLGVMAANLQDQPSSDRYAQLNFEQVQRQLAIEGETPRTLWALYNAYQARASAELAAQDRPGANESFSMMLSTGERLIKAAPEERRYVGEVVAAMAQRAATFIQSTGASPETALAAAEALCVRAERIVNGLPELDRDTMEVITGRLWLAWARASLADARGEFRQALDWLEPTMEMVRVGKATGMVQSDYDSFERRHREEIARLRALVNAAK